MRCMRILTSFPPESERRSRRSGEYDRMFDGQTWELRRGEDFTRATAVHANLIRQAARNRRLDMDRLDVRCAGEQVFVRYNRPVNSAPSAS